MTANAKTADSSVLRILAVDRYRHVWGCGTPTPILPKCAEGGIAFCLGYLACM